MTTLHMRDLPSFALVRYNLDRPAGGATYQSAKATGSDSHMATFDVRQKGFEQKYKHDKELQFKINARRNKLLGLWAAKELGIPDAEADAYAKSVVLADFEKPGDDDVVEKVLADFKQKGIEMSEHRVRKHMAELLDAARTQVMNEVK
jgi:hypothetical protein